MELVNHYEKAKMNI